MAYVDTNKILSNPMKFWRLYYVLEPLLPNDFELRRGQFGKGVMDDLLEEARENAKNWRSTASLDSYRKAHQHLKDKLPKLKDKNIIFTTGISIDQGQPSKYIGYDFYSERWKLSDLFLKNFNKSNLDYQERYNSKAERLADYVFIPVAPFLMPAKAEFKDSQIYFTHPFKEIYTKINKELSEKKRLKHLNLEKRLSPKALAHEAKLLEELIENPATPNRIKLAQDYKITLKLLELAKDNKEILGQKGNYRFSDLLFSPEEAKKNIEDATEEELEKSTYLNKQIMAQAYTTIFELLELTEIKTYAKRTSYVMDIFHSLDPKYKIRDFGGIMRNTKLSKDGECDPSAICSLEGPIWYNLIKNAN